MSGDVFANQWKGPAAEGWGAGAVGYSGRVVNSLKDAGSKRAGGVIGEFRFDSDDTTLRGVTRTNKCRPLSNPPPPVGTRITSGDGATCDNNSSATVPWPAMTSG